jgi:tetratricopeptide (TPR) repeat protein
VQFARLVPGSLVLLLIACAAVRADVLELRDGTKVTGKFAWRGDIAEMTADNGATWEVPKAEVARVTITGTASPADAAKAEWDFENARIATLDDLNAILMLHEKFLSKFGNEPIADTAKSSLAKYQALQGKDAVKFRGRWMPAADVAALKQTWDDQALPALRHYSAGDFKNAITDANAALKADATNPVALTILGLAQFRVKNVTGAAAAFKTILETDPADVVALNNLAVTAWPQNFRQAFVYYAKAITAAPGNRLLMDNIAEALNAQGKQGDSLATQLYGLWKKNEPAVEAQLAPQGLSRWGAVWVDSRQRQTLDTVISQNQASLRSAQQAFNSDQSTVDRLSGELAENDREYRDTYLIEDPEQANVESGRLMEERNGLNDRFAEAQAAANESARQIDVLQKTLDDFFATQFAGQQRLMMPGDDAKPPPPLKVTLPDIAP